MTDPFGNVGRGELATRRNLKWTRYGPDVLAAWLADMDLPTPPFIAEVVEERTLRGELGYPPDSLPDELAEAFVSRSARSWGWEVDRSRVVIATDVMTGVCQVIDELTAPGDEILVPTPVYPPFLVRPTELDRSVVEVPLGRGAVGPTFDVEALDSAVTARTRVIALVNPHNPTGRVFTAEELRSVVALAEHHDLTIVSDEIHADLVHGDATHVPVASLGETAARRTVTVTAATKAFNLAGFRCAVVVVPPGAERLMASRRAGVRGEISTLSALVTIEAWTRGDGWLGDLRLALTARRDHLVARLRTECPAIGIDAPEATFLAWLDVSAFALGPDPSARLVDAAALALNPGSDFGAVGAGHLRMNFATPWGVLDEAIDRLVGGLDRVGDVAG